MPTPEINDSAAAPVNAPAVPPAIPPAFTAIFFTHCIPEICPLIICTSSTLEVTAIVAAATTIVPRNALFAALLTAPLLALDAPFLPTSANALPTALPLKLKFITCFKKLLSAGIFCACAPTI